MHLRNSPRRTLLFVMSAALAVVAVGVFLVAAFGGGNEATLTGTDLDKKPAPDFTLTDHRGQSISLGDFEGKAVALTFIYTNCPDVCPLTAENFRAAYQLLDEETRDDVALVAVTVDPERDTAEALQTFSDRHRLGDNPNWYALNGDLSVLEGVWSDYGIDPGSMLSREGEDHNLLAHTDAVYVIDAEGRQRVLMRSDLDPTALAENLEALV
ncbi:MAG: SCO family protein [Thermomicrobiales bacterium]